MFRSAILSVGLAIFVLGLTGCGGGSSAKQLNEDEKNKIKEDMMKAKPGSPGPN